MEGTPHQARAVRELTRVRRAILVLDLVDSMRLMQLDEAATIRLWLSFVECARGTILPDTGGRLVKSLGDGLLIQFSGARDAVCAAFKLHEAAAEMSKADDRACSLQLRIGLNIADVVVDDLDVYGSGVNLAARIATLARPGETVASAEVCDEVVDGLDARIEDLGDCFFKHVDEPVRAFRLRPVDRRQSVRDVLFSEDHLAPTLAVIPFRVPAGQPPGGAFGDAIADDVIAALSVCRSLRVISRLSTCAFRHADADASTIHAVLGASYVVSGSCRGEGDRVRVFVELSDARSGNVVWAWSTQASVSGVFSGADPLVDAIAARVASEVLRVEVSRTHRLPIPTLEAYTLYLGGVALLHRLSPENFMRSREILQALHERHPRCAAPIAMLAKWHVLHVLHGMSDDAVQDGRRAQDLARRAMELDPGHALARAMDALVTSHFGSDPAKAREGALAAVDADAQEPQAWLTLAGVHSYCAEGASAVAAAQRAISLSPVDPARSLFDLLLGAGYLSLGRHEDAVACAKESLRRQAGHLATLRLLVISLVLGGRMKEAREAANALMRLAPDFRVGVYERRYPGRHHPHAGTYMEALRLAGVPR